MKKQPIGVWFSVALVILLLGLWAGSKLGAKFAEYWYRQQRQEQGTMYGPERAHVESLLSELSALQTLRIYAVVAHNDAKIRKKWFLNEIGGLEAFARRSDAQEIRPVIDLDLGLAYVEAAMAEEQDNNKELAAKYMKSAEDLFQSLGWQDHSEETLRIVARRELDRWNAQPQRKERGK